MSNIWLQKKNIRNNHARVIDKWSPHLSLVRDEHRSLVSYLTEGICDLYQYDVGQIISSREFLLLMDFSEYLSVKSFPKYINFVGIASDNLILLDDNGLEDVWDLSSMMEHTYYSTFDMSRVVDQIEADIYNDMLSLRRNNIYKYNYCLKYLDVFGLNGCQCSFAKVIFLDR